MPKKSLDEMSSLFQHHSHCVMASVYERDHKTTLTDISFCIAILEEMRDKVIEEATNEKRKRN